MIHDWITAETSIEELSERLPPSVAYLSEHGIRCIICGEPVWGTLRSAAREKGFAEEAIQGFVEDLRRLAG
ncbi:MAG TPA: hypothetical protein P5550_10745 [Bacteroidales bacterium]|nr:hypothetical protein [Bacteroidales bacterium]